MSELKQKNLDSARGNIEIEGYNVPDNDTIKYLILKYKEKLGDAAIDSLLYSIVKGEEIINEECKYGRRK